jgi:hypothetical protein
MQGPNAVHGISVSVSFRALVRNYWRLWAVATSGPRAINPDLYHGECRSLPQLLSLQVVITIVCLVSRSKDGIQEQPPSPNQLSASFC